MQMIVVGIDGKACAEAAILVGVSAYDVFTLIYTFTFLAFFIFTFTLDFLTCSIAGSIFIAAILALADA